MLLAIDIGNTHTVVGLLKGQELLNHWRIASHMGRTEDEIGAVLSNLFKNEGYSTAEISGACISSVVPDLTPVFSMMCSRYLKIQPLLIHSGLDLGMKIKYRDPSAVGADRLCNAVAGVAKYGKPLIIIDFGTATTFDCIDKNGDYVGGLIAAGIYTSIKALHLNAAKLPHVDLHFPEHLIGQTTDESIQSGILYGAVHMIEGLVSSIKNELGETSRVIATGGLAEKIARNAKSIEAVDSYLNLEGIAYIYLRNAN